MVVTKLLAHLETWRPYTLLHAGLVGLGGAALAAQAGLTWQQAVLIAGAPTLGWIAALYGCDYLDQELDRIAKPQRPIPSGRMKPKEAFAAMLMAIYLGLGCAGVLGLKPFLLSGAVLVCGASYAMRFKARGFLGNLVRGLEATFTFWFGVAAVGQSLGARLLLMALAYLAHDAATNLIGAVRDREGDRAGGYMTLPVRLGVRGAAAVAFCLTVGWAGALVSFPFLYAVHPAYWAFAGLAMALKLAAYVPLTANGWAPDPRQALRSHKILVIERLVLSGAMVAGGLGWAPALGVLLPAVGVTALAQWWLRDRHEYGKGNSAAAQAPDAAAIRRWAEGTIAALTATPPRGLAGWDRRVTVAVSDLALAFHLAVTESRIQLLTRAEYEASSLPEAVIQLKAAAFADLFLHRRLSPHIALLTGHVRIQAAPADLVRLNALVTEFLRRQPPAETPVQAPQVDVVQVAAGRQEPDRPRTVVLADTTLRDGEQMPGVAFAPAQKLQIARLLDHLGIPLIEAGYPAVSAEELAAIQAIAAAGLKANIQVIARPVPADIDRAVESGAQTVALFIGTSDYHLQHKLQLTRSEALDSIRRGVAYARRFPIQIAFAPEDATRTELPFLLECCRAAVAEGADAIGIPDTVGVMTPERMTALVGALVRALPVPVAVHCHNDFGLATANSLAGVLAGAAGVQCSLGGIGERAGNAPLEEVAVALSEQYGLTTGLKLTELTAAVDTLYRIMGLPVPPTKPIVGRNAFAHESGLHMAGVTRDASTYEPFTPDKVGQQRRFVYGKHTGRRAILSALARHSLPAEESMTARLLAEVKQRGETGMALSEEELVQLATQWSHS